MEKARKLFMAFRILVLTEKAKRLLFALCILVFTETGYKIIQKIAVKRDFPFFLTQIDRDLPLTPWWILIYASVLVTLVAAGWVLEHQEFILTFKRVLIAQGISFIIFWRASIPYPRPDTAIIQNDFFRWGFDLMYKIDGPNNTFPSMHVSLTWIVMYQLWHHGLPRWACVLYAILVCLSTLFTKQHFVYDIAGGFVVFLATLVICRDKPAVVQ